MMKKTGILTMILSLIIVTFCLNGFAQQISAQVSALEKQAQLIQNRIDQAKKRSAIGMKQQIQALKTSMNHLMQQRVGIDAQIAKLEGQIQDLESSSNAVLNRQIKQYNKELNVVKQQISSLMAKQAAKAAQKHPVAPKPAAVQKAPAPKTIPAAKAKPVPAAKAKPVPAAKAKPVSAAKPCPSCPSEPAAKTVPVAKAVPAVKGKVATASAPAAKSVNPAQKQATKPVVAPKVPVGSVGSAVAHAKVVQPAQNIPGTPAKKGPAPASK